MTARDAPRARSRDYRRGTVMGFTVAEVFLLLGFALVLLLILTRAQERERTAEAEAFHARFTPAERALLETARAEGWLDRLARAGTVAEALPTDALREKARDLPPADIAAALDLALTGELSRLGETAEALRNGARLVEEADLIALVDAAKTLPAARRDDLVDLVSVEGQEDAAAFAREVARLAAAGHRPEDIARALALLATLDPGEQPGVDALRDRIRERLALAEAETRTLADRLRATAGTRIAALGGTIDPASGTVTLPDRALFDPGSARIRPDLGRFLDSFCPDWLALLADLGPRIDRILIEGHASSEWLDADPRQAFLNNMTLSQARAQAVLAHCLGVVGDRPAAPFARAHLVAVGHSSARPVLADGVEDREASRRVVFRVEFDRDALLGDIARDLTAPAAP